MRCAKWNYHCHLSKFICTTLVTVENVDGNSAATCINETKKIK